MIRTIRNAVAVFALLTTPALQAQSTGGADLQVRTFLLQYLSPDDAAAFVAPYVDYVPGGGVFRANAVRGITVRAVPSVMLRVDSLLKASDKPRPSVKLTFVVVEALGETAPPDPELTSMDKELRSVLRYKGYRQIALGLVTTEEARLSELTLSDGESQPFSLRVSTQRVDLSGKGVIQLEIGLEGWPWSARANGGRSGTPILGTGLTVPIGQSVVVGSGSATVFDKSGSRSRPMALLLVVRADPVAK
jgi:hypothetical protein